MEERKALREEQRRLEGKAKRLFQGNNQSVNMR